MGRGRGRRQATHQEWRAHVRPQQILEPVPRILARFAGEGIRQVSHRKLAMGPDSRKHFQSRNIPEVSRNLRNSTLNAKLKELKFSENGNYHFHAQVRVIGLKIVLKSASEIE